MTNRRNAIYSLLIGSLLAGMFSGKALFYTVAYVLGGLLVVAWVWAWGSVSWVRIRRITRARRAQVGQLFEENFNVRNTSLFPKLWLEFQDHSTLPTYQTKYVTAGIAPRRQHQWQSSVTCVQRGEFQLGPMTMSAGDPFGLFTFPRHIPATSKIVVYPATEPLHNFAIPSGLLSGGDAQRRRAHFVTTNAAGVRDYAPGDSYNRIHWRSTARKNRLLVKEFELDPLADVWVFLDLSASSQVGSPIIQPQPLNGTSYALPHSTEEYGVVIAASIAKFFLDKGRNLGLITYGPNREILHADRSQRQLNQVLELLAVVKGIGSFDLEHMLSLNTEYLGRGTTVVIITPDHTTSWVEEAHILTSRGIRIITVLMDPSSFGGQGTVDDVQASLATFNAPTYVVHAGDNLSAVLSTPMH